jgi:hypothetical protein
MSAVDSAHAPEQEEAQEGLWSFPAAGVMLLAAGVIVLTAWWIFHGKLPPAKSVRHQSGLALARPFIHEPEFVLWLLILCAQAAVWTLALLLPIRRIFFRRVRELPRKEGLKRFVLPLELVGAALVLAALAAALSMPPHLVSHFGSPGRLSNALDKLPRGSEWPVPNYELKIGVFEALGFFVGISGVVTMWIVGLTFKKLEQTADRSKRLVEFVTRRDELNTLLTIIGVIVGLGTLATGALQNAISTLHDHYPSQTQFPREYVLIFGLYYSALLALAYAPCYVAMRNAGEKLKDAFFGKLASSPDAVDAMTKRRSLDDLLQLNVSASSSFKAGVAILTPLAGSLVGLLIGKG